MMAARAATGTARHAGCDAWARTSVASISAAVAAGRCAYTRPSTGDMVVIIIR